MRSSLLRRALLASVLTFGAWTSLAQAQSPPPGSWSGKQPWVAVAATEPPAEQTWVDQSKHPVPWFRWGGDLRLREEYFNNAITLDKDAPGHEWNFQRYRARLWGTAMVTDMLDLNAKLTWEGRHWSAPSSMPDEWDNGELVFDNLNAKFKKPGGLPVTATIGRQDIILGDGWLVLEGTPLDGSRTIYFDALRFTFDFAKDHQTTADVIYIDQSGNTGRWLKPVGDQDKDIIEQDERGVILWVNNKSIQKTSLDGYFIWKQSNAIPSGTLFRSDDHPVKLARGDTGDIFTLGGRIAYDINENWKASLEGAGQMGERGGQDVLAFGAKGRIAYLFNDAWKNQVRLTYEMLTGDDPGSDQNEAFSPLWGRWPQWSDLYVYTYAAETRIAEITNLHRVNLGWQFSPCKQADILLDYHALFADENTFGDRGGYSSDGSFRGHLATAALKYRVNRFVSGHLLGEIFFPGDYYADARHDTAAFLRAEIMLTY